MKIGIVGSGADKFNTQSEYKAKELIHDIISQIQLPIVVSGHSPVGGIDIWAEEEAQFIRCPVDIKIPKQHTWNAEYGYKQRNLDIAKDSDEVHVIVVNKYPKDYKGMRFDLCYHCKSKDHIKSGGCWTGLQAQKLGKKVYWHIIKNE
jgi:hypothetical protein